MWSRNVCIALTLCASLYVLADLAAIAWSWDRPRAGPCRPDNEGKWAIGLYRGASPLQLAPIESAVPRIESNVTRAWPTANPILTCSSVLDAPSNFVADPFLWPGRDGVLHLFFETKTIANMQGDIAVAESRDGGASWQYLGIALDEPWHLSYPYIFEHEGQVYMLPEGAASGSLRLYVAELFPLRWKLAKILIDRPLIDTAVVEHNGTWWMFTTGVGEHTVKNGELEVYHARSPLGPWRPHALNPVKNGDPGAGARMGGRPVVHDGRLYRFGQDCKETYGHKVVAYHVELLTTDAFVESQVDFSFGESHKAAAAWNGVRHHHVDAHEVSTGNWIAVMDGDYMASGPFSTRVVARLLTVASIWAALAALLLITECCLPRLAGYVPVANGASAAESNRVQSAFGAAWIEMRVRGTAVASALQSYLPTAATRASSLPVHTASLLSASSGSLQFDGTRSSPSRRNPYTRVMDDWLRHVRCVLCPGDGARSSAGRMACLVLCAVFAAAATTVLLSMGGGMLFYYSSIRWDRPLAVQAVPVYGAFSQYTILVTSSFSRHEMLKQYVKHYSQCPSVAEITVMWAAGPAPFWLRHLSSTTPVRFRDAPEVRAGRHSHYSHNNRFLPDPQRRTRPVLFLDDDVLIPCYDVERAFARWREHPSTLTGFSPALLQTSPHASIFDERDIARRGQYNAVLTDAAFLDADTALPAYWGERWSQQRDLVNSLHGCEDILMNLVLATAARENRTVESNRTVNPPTNAAQGMEETYPPVQYVRPWRRWLVRGWFSQPRLSAAQRQRCVAMFSNVGANVTAQAAKAVSQDAKLGPPHCSFPGLWCPHSNAY